MSALESEIERLIEPVVERVVERRLAEVRPAEGGPDLYRSIKEASAITGIPRQTIKSRVRQGRVTRERTPGRNVLVKISDLVHAG